MEGLVRLSWDAIRRSLGLPEAETENADQHEPHGPRRTPGASRRDRERRGQELDMEVAGDGVSVSPMPVTEGQRVTVTYQGALAREGAGAIYLHYGYGPGPWQDVQEVAMTPVDARRYEASIQVRNAGRLEFCFRDSQGRWDNNQGRNWSCPLHSGGGSLA